MNMLKLWKLYQKSLYVHPVKTQVISSAVIWGFGDIAAQSITHWTIQRRIKTLDQHEKFHINWNRVASTSFFGFALVGPIGHFWYEGLDRVLRSRFLMQQPKSFSFVATKVVADGILLDPFFLFIFFSYVGFSEGKSISDVKEQLKRDFVPALILEGAVWPIVQIANFRFVPVRYQLLYVNLFCLLDSCFLSWVEQQESAPWKQNILSFFRSNSNENNL